MAKKQVQPERAAPASDKDRALATALAQIEKNFGKGSIMRLGERQSSDIGAISTGSLTLDVALGVGGIPKGRVIEIYGPESSGKTTLALHVIASCQKSGGTAAFVDAEHALDPVYAKALGVDTENLLISQPDTGEQGLEITEALVRSGAVDIVVIDSVAALVPRAEIEAMMGDSVVGLQARLMSQALRKLTGAISKTNCTVIFINQLREKIGIMYGNPETTTGGRALKFYSSVRLDVRKVEAIKVGTESIGNRTRVRVTKNKVAPPFKEAVFEIIFGEGISRTGEIVDIGISLDVIEKAGSWFTINGERIQGRDGVRKYLKDNPEVAEQIEQSILEKQRENGVELTRTTISDFDYMKVGVSVATGVDVSID
ncbi:MAG: recombinase RecA [Oscillospiraceae bacterium]|jgi:recombination protein RecA|nr:recombinase RecA [Oscillospiraceae bacterium]